VTPSVAARGDTNPSDATGQGDLIAYVTQLLYDSCCEADDKC